MAHVVSLVYRPMKTTRPQDHYLREPVERATLVEFQGIEGDQKGGTGKRQLNIMVAEQLAELRAEGFNVAPGEMGEQVVVSGIDPAALLAVGSRWRIGAAVVEVTIPRTGCDRFERIQGKAKESVQGRLGVLAKVVTGGEVAVGDPVELLPATD